MKNAMKKLMSVLLVAVLLVSAIPFQASAAGGTVNFTVKIGTLTSNTVFSSDEGIAITGTTATVRNMLKYHFATDWESNYTCVKAWSTANQTDVGVDGSVADGDTLTVILTPISSSTTETTEATEATTTTAAIDIVVKVDDSDSVVWTGSKVPANGSYATVQNLLKYCWNSAWDDVYTFDHAWSHVQQKNISLTGSIYAGDTVYIMLTTSSSSSSSSATSTYNKFPYNVYLRVYMNNDVDTVNRTLDITNGIALDGVVTLAEVRSLLLNYYTANDDNGIQIDGMYLAEGNWVANFVNDTEKYDTITTDDARNYKTVFINVMLTNATASSSSSSTADSTNPKTGDTIMAPVAMLGLSATALAVFFLNKKRLAL